MKDAVGGITKINVGKATQNAALTTAVLIVGGGTMAIIIVENVGRVTRGMAVMVLVPRTTTMIGLNHHRNVSIPLMVAHLVANNGTNLVRDYNFKFKILQMFCTLRILTRLMW